MKKKVANEELEAIAEVAMLYYQDDMSQQEIANALFYSRSKVSRMLKSAKHLGIVEIGINYPVDRMRILENQLIKMFPLNNVIVVKNTGNSESEMLQRVCRIGSKYIDEMIRDGMIIGISWGATVHHLIRAIKPHLKKEIKVVQLTGVISNAKSKNYDSSEIVRTLAKKYGGEYMTLPVPLYVSDTQISKMLMDQPLIESSFDIGKKADFIVTGISDFNIDSNVIWAQTLPIEQRKELLDKGAVGILLSHFIDENGNLVDESFDQKVMSMKLCDLKKAKQVVGIANGKKKAKPIFAALKSGYFSDIIIDDILALELMQEYDRHLINR